MSKRESCRCQLALAFSWYRCCCSSKPTRRTRPVRCATGLISLARKSACMDRWMAGLYRRHRQKKADDLPGDHPSPRRVGRFALTSVRFSLCEWRACCWRSFIPRTAAAAATAAARDKIFETIVDNAISRLEPRSCTGRNHGAVLR